jgi:hypothetical protein
MNRSKLIQTLEAVGKPTQNWESPDGSRVLLLPYGGRILGLFAPGDDESFFWSHPTLESAETAREFYAGGQWHNSGGERTWLGPEADFFFPDFPDLTKYFQQRELDPGKYEVVGGNGVLNWKTRATLTLSRTKQKVDLEIAKSLTPALNPLRYDREVTDAGVKYAGYNLRATLQFKGSGTPPPIGLWHLTQLPHGGDMLVPTHSSSRPKIYMGSISPEDLIVGDHLIRYKMRAGGEHKLGVRATALTGRAGYLRASDGEASLVVRNFMVNPSGEYVDVPWTETKNFGFAFQACNVNSQLGAFSELEYHVPAIGAPDGSSRSDDQSQLWAFRGPEAAVKSIARRLLSSEID